jgi:DNA primase
MPVNENFLSQLKSVVDPLMVFSQYLSLKKSGNRYRALCPFHSEKTPSFYAHENGMFHCFGCGAGGDVVKFVMMMEKMDFKDSIRLLSSRYGIPLRQYSTGERKEKEELLQIMNQTAEFYHNLLTAHQTGHDALEYLEKRGISREGIRRFQLGWAPASWSALLEHFEKKSVSPAMLEKCGLVVARTKEGYYDRYRSRIMVPIHDINGNIIGFGGRIFGATSDEAKYLNSPETDLYSKSHHLFGLYLSKDEIRQKNCALLVEGYFDTIAPFETGHKNIVASLGTSLTEQQAHLLRRYAEHVVVLYDPDAAGQSAALRALPILLRENFSVRIASLPSGLDPDAVIQSSGSEGLQQQLDQALPYDQFFIAHLLRKHDLKNPSGKLAATGDLIELITSVANPFERQHLFNHFASAIGVPVELLQEQFRRKKKSTTNPQQPAPSRQQIQVSERKLLQICLMNPAIARPLLEQLTDEDYEELGRPELFRTLQQIVNKEAEFSSAEIIHEYPAEVQDLLTSLVFAEEMPEPVFEEAREWLDKIRANRQERLLQQLNQQIDEAQRRPDADELNRLLAEKFSLGRRIKTGPIKN